MRPAFLSATHGPRSKVNLQLGWGERDELDMLDLIALAITKRNKYHLLVFGDLCSAITGLPKSLGALDDRRQRTALESHNGRSALAAGTGAPAPHLPFAIPVGSGSVGWEAVIRAPPRDRLAEVRY